MSNPTPPNFIIAVFSQPIASFAKWKARGINTLVSHEPEGGSVKKSVWEAAAAQAGLFFMDYPDLAALAAEAAQPYRLAWMQDDEPDLTRTPGPNTNPDGTTKANILEARYAACKAAAPTMPVFLNLAGPQFTSEAYKGEKHLPYIKAADWLAHDWYVKNKNVTRYPIELIGKAMDRLAMWSTGKLGATAPVMKPGDGKPQLVFIECSDQDISTLGRGPTPDEMEAEINLAVARGARGIVYFPQKPPPGFQFDATTPELVERMVAVNARLAPPTPTDPLAEALQKINDQGKRLAALEAMVTLIDGATRDDVANTNAAHARITELDAAVKAAGARADAALNTLGKVAAALGTP